MKQTHETHQDRELQHKCEEVIRTDLYDNKSKRNKLLQKG